MIHRHDPWPIARVNDRVDRYQSCSDCLAGGKPVVGFRVYFGARRDRYRSVYLCIDCIREHQHQLATARWLIECEAKRPSADAAE